MWRQTVIMGTKGKLRASAAGRPRAPRDGTRTHDLVEGCVSACMATGRGEGPCTTTTIQQRDNVLVFRTTSLLRGRGDSTSARIWRPRFSSRLGIAASDIANTDQRISRCGQGGTYTQQRPATQTFKADDATEVGITPPKAFCLGSRERALRNRLPYSRSNTSGLMVLFRHTTFISTSAVVLTVISRTVARPAVPTPVISTSPHR